MQRLYFKYRVFKTGGKKLKLGKITYNGIYYPSFFFNDTRSWYVENAGVVIHDSDMYEKVKDNLLETGKVSGEPRKEKLFGYIDFNETIVSYEDLKFDIENDLKLCGVHTRTVQETIDGLKEFTNCEEVSPGKFLLNEYIWTNELGDETPPKPTDELEVTDNGDGTYNIKEYLIIS